MARRCRGKYTLAMATAPGGEGILPSLAPLGAHDLITFEPMRLAAHCEGKMPSPQGPSLPVATRYPAALRLLARPNGRVGSSLRELLAFVLAFARSYG